MVQPVIQRTTHTPQLITRRKVGRPDKDRPVNEAAMVERKNPSQSAPKHEDQPEVQVYDLKASEGLQFKRFLPTGQYLDTYA